MECQVGDQSMTLEELEKEVKELRLAVAELQSRVSVPVPEKPGILSILGSMKDIEGFDEMIAYGRYYRMTGQDPPDDWKPGDPIPEASEEWCPR
jgi:hypothetical protein